MISVYDMWIALQAKIKKPIHYPDFIRDLNESQHTYLESKMNKPFLNEMQDMARQLKKFSISSVTKKVNTRKFELMTKEFETYSTSHLVLDGHSFRIVVYGIIIKIENDPDWFKLKDYGR